MQKQIVADIGVKWAGDGHQREAKRSAFQAGEEHRRERAAEGRVGVGAGRRRMAPAPDEEEEESGEGQSDGMQPEVAFGYCVMRGMVEGNGGRRRRRDYVVAEMARVQPEKMVASQEEEAEEEEVAIFGVFDEHGGGDVGRHLQAALFNNIFREGGFWSDPAGATRDAYLLTDRHLLRRHPASAAAGGSTALTVMILQRGARMLVANLGDSRAVLCKNGIAVQLSVDHTPARPLERANVQMRGGVVVTIPGDIPRVDGLLAVARTFGDAGVKEHMSAKPDVSDVVVDISLEFLIMGSNGLWAAFSSNQEAVDLARGIADPVGAAKFLAHQARARGSGDEISCIIVRFREL